MMEEIVRGGKKRKDTYIYTLEVQSTHILTIDCTHVFCTTYTSSYFVYCRIW